jgi:hypothetical protein
LSALLRAVEGAAHKPLRALHGADAASGHVLAVDDHYAVTGIRRVANCNVATNVIFYRL